MKLRFALISEGSTEESLVAHLRNLCWREAGPRGIDSVDGRWVNPQLNFLDVPKDVESRVRAVMDEGGGVDLLFIHRDADARTDHLRRTEVERCIVSSDCGIAYVPIIPIQEIEGWLLVDPDAIRRAVANPESKDDLELPKLGQIEQRAKPKEALRDALRRASKPGRRNAIDERAFGRLRRELLQNLDIDGPVNQLSAWQNLLRDLRAVMAEFTPTSES